MSIKTKHFFPVAAFLFAIISLFPISAQGVNITQVDTSLLLAAQKVKLYLDIDVPANGPEVGFGNISIAESADGIKYTDVPLKSVSRSASRDEGISFLFLIDNSGSMWDGLDGTASPPTADMRITHAKKAVNDFVGNISAMDRVGLAYFNTNYVPVQEISSDASGISASLGKILRPAREEAYTELYGAIEQALTGFGEDGRRKVLVVLSDGEHYPPASTNSVSKPEDGIEAANREGITCYVVNFAPEKDSRVQSIASESGGLVFDARDSGELLGIYTTIRTNILDEYSVVYTAAMISGDKRFVKATYRGATSSGESVRYYYSGTVLGSNAVKPGWLYLLVFFIPLAAWLAFLFFRLEKETTEAGLQLLYGARGMQTKVFTLSGNQTVIGGNADADITIAGNPSMKENAATILFDKTKMQYTITSPSDMTVNNKSVTKKILESGDVINISGTVVVFDKDERMKKK